ncbi:MAG: TPR repeat protein, partial [Candidatus Paceibacteria bacterium]
QGHASAQVNLGVMYNKGQGVLEDYVKAHMWFNLSASQGNEVAKKNRDIVAGMMTPAHIADAQKMAREWLTTHPGL